MWIKIVIKYKGGLIMFKFYYKILNKYFENMIWTILLAAGPASELRAGTPKSALRISILLHRLPCADRKQGQTLAYFICFPLFFFRNNCYSGSFATPRSNSFIYSIHFFQIVSGRSINLFSINQSQMWNIN